MAYLPTEPLLPYLHGAIDEHLRGQGGFRSGMQGVAHELSRVTGYSYNASERQLHRILTGSINRINDRTADAVASALGMTPIEIWSDWYEITCKRVSGWSCLRPSLGSVGLVSHLSRDRGCDRQRDENRFVHGSGSDSQPTPSPTPSSSS